MGCVECARCVCVWDGRAKCASSWICTCAEAESGGLGYFGSMAVPYRSGGALHPGPRRVVCGRRHEPRELRGGRAASFACIREAGPRGSASARTPHPAASRAGIPLPRCPPGFCVSGEGRGGAGRRAPRCSCPRICQSPGLRQPGSVGEGKAGKAWHVVGKRTPACSFPRDLSGGPRSWPQC